LPRFIVAGEAENDIVDIAQYLKSLDLKAAVNFIDELYAANALLADSPALGHRRDDLTTRPVRFWTVMSRYMIVYRATTPIEVVRVLSGRRDVAQILRRGH